MDHKRLSRCIRVFKLFRGAFPDIHIDVERTVTEGDVVAAYCHVTGTHTGDGWNCFDFLTMYQQLGTMPPMPAA